MFIFGWGLHQFHLVDHPKVDLDLFCLEGKAPTGFKPTLDSGTLLQADTRATHLLPFEAGTDLGIPRTKGTKERRFSSGFQLIPIESVPSNMEAESLKESRPKAGGTPYKNGNPDRFRRET